MSDTLTLTINGETEVLSGMSPTTTLLEHLRHSGRVGTKEGCAEGDCGACTVAVVDEGADGKPMYVAMNSCLIPVASLAGRDIITVEGVASTDVDGRSRLHPVQRAMVDLGGSQCGYCTPGFIMSLFAAYYNGELDDAAVEGNLCRCTGYLPIRRAIKTLGEPDANDPFRLKLEQVLSGDQGSGVRDQGDEPTPESRISNPHSSPASNQQFFRPNSLPEALELLQNHPEARVVAGATDLGLEITQRKPSMPVLVSLEHVSELKGITDTADALTIGAAVPLSHIETRCKGIFPALDEMIHWFAARQIRNRATIGGNLGTASPIGDLPPVLMALDAELKLVSAAGERTVSVSDFFTGYRQTVLKPGELIASISIPKALPQGATQRLSQSYKVAKRGTDDISTVAAAFTVDLDKRDKIVQARLAYGGVAATPVRALEVETFLEGKRWEEKTVLEAKALLADSFTPLSDVRGSSSYRQRLIVNLFAKFMAEYGEERMFLQRTHP